ncbi:MULTISPECIES: TetR/AcrR family transcriptional regulator [Parabacteroides]|uniref:TetR/AcrR family transcriptional regulator n=1 Tax=Parabacteroides provencensis TaxID=1944636 RepID=UPI000C15C32C|nr:TetR/AcrR family transcriptional regulator [Parabacteroides provencensis]
MNTEEVQDMEFRIIEAAKQVFVRKGYEATKMGDIAEEVGISRTAMHYYFRTKEMLFEAIFGQLMGVLLPNIDSIMNESTTCLEKIPKIVNEYVAIMQSNPSFPIFVINEFNRDPEHLYKVVMRDPSRVQPLIKLQKQMLEEMEKGLIKKMPLAYTASTLIGLVIFPMLARSPLTTVFFNGEEERFDAFIEERKTFISDIMIRLLTPDNK